MKIQNINSNVYPQSSSMTYKGSIDKSVHEFAKLAREDFLREKIQTSSKNHILLSVEDLKKCDDYIKTTMDLLSDKAKVMHDNSIIKVESNKNNKFLVVHNSKLNAKVTPMISEMFERPQHFSGQISGKSCMKEENIFHSNNLFEKDFSEKEIFPRYFFKLVETFHPKSTEIKLANKAVSEIYDMISTKFSPKKLKSLQKKYK